MRKQRDRLFTVFRHLNLETGQFEQLDQQIAVFHIVVDHQHPGHGLVGGQTDHKGRMGFFPNILLSCMNVNFKTERTAFPFPTGHSKVTTHQTGVIPADGHSQSAAALALYPCCGLLEIPEHLVQFVRGDARAGILDLRHQTHSTLGAGRHGHPHDNTAFLHEFNGVSQQIDQYLPQLAFVCHHIACEFICFNHFEKKALGIGFQAKHGFHILNQGLQINGHRFQGNLLRLNAGYRQHIVDQCQQMGTAAADRIQILTLLPMQ